jgi:hypothetical protein
MMILVYHFPYAIPSEQYLRKISLKSRGIYLIAHEYVFTTCYMSTDVM